MLGSTVQFRAGKDATTATVRSLTRNLDETLAIFAEKLLEPKLDPADFARVQQQMTQAIALSRDQAGATAETVYDLLLLGRDNPVAHLDMGTPETVPQLTVDDARAFYATRYSPSIASLVVVTDLDEAELRPKLAALEAWQGPAVERTPLAPFPDTGATRLYLVDKPGAAQSEIRIGKRALPYDATGEYYRSPRQLRPRRRLQQPHQPEPARGQGLYLRRALGVRRQPRLRHVHRVGGGADRRDGGVDRRVGERDPRLRGGRHHPRELAFTRNAIGQRDALSYETPFQKLGFLSRILTYGLDDDFVDRQNEILAAISAGELNGVAAKHMTMDDMIIVVVGDRATIQDGLEGLGYEIVLLGADGAPVDAGA